MSNLLYKELRLAAHPTLFVFILLGALVLIPSYPYTTVFLYASLAVYHRLLRPRNNDVYYTALLPLKKVAVVQGKIYLTLFSQLATCSCPFPSPHSPLN